MMRTTLSALVRRHATPMLLVAAISLSLAIASGTRAWVRSASPDTSGSLTPPLAPSTSGRERLETELVTVTPTGFEPVELTRPAGRFILDVDNRSGLEEVELRLDKLRGARERAVRVSRTALDWRDTLRLQPGTYVLTEAHHPQWSCRITITSR